MKLTQPHLTTLVKLTDERNLQICAMALFDAGHDTQEIYDFLSAIDPDIEIREALTLPPQMRLRQETGRPCHPPYGCGRGTDRVPTIAEVVQPRILLPALVGKVHLA